LTDNTTAGIVKRIEDDQAASLPGQVSCDKLTLHYLANLSVAKELEAAYEAIDVGLEGIDVLKATGSKLDAIVSHVLINGRELGEYATGAIEFSTSYASSADIVIPAGTKCYAIMEDGTKLYFVTTAAATIVAGGTSITVAARAVVRGITGNIAAYDIIAMVSRITGVTACENAIPFTGGTPDETDDELRTRYFDAIQAPGRATALMIQRSLGDLADVSEVRAVNYGSGDVGILVAYSGGIEETSKDIVDAISENIAAGVQARGCLGATIDGARVTVLNDDVYGGLIWVRPRNFIASEEVVNLTYLDMNGTSQAATATIPAGTHRGEMIAAAMVNSDSRGKKILTADPSSAGNLYDVLLGMGEAGYLYNLPELITVGITGKIRLTETPDTGLKDLIEDSLAAFLGSFYIGQRLEYSDVVRFVYNLFDPKAIETECVGRPFIGIDELTELIISAGDQAATQNGDRITVEEDWRLIAGEVRIEVVT